MKLFKITNGKKVKVDHNKENSEYFYQDDGEYSDFESDHSVRNTTIALVPWNTGRVVYIIELENKDVLRLNDNKGYINSAGNKYVVGYETALFESIQDNINAFLKNFETGYRSKLSTELKSFGITDVIALY